MDPLSARIIAHVVEVLPCENFDDLLAESAGVEEGVIDFYLVFAVYLLLLHEVNHKN